MIKIISGVDFVGRLSLRTEFPKSTCKLYLDGYNPRCRKCNNEARMVHHNNKKNKVLEFNRLNVLQTSLNLCVRCWKPLRFINIDHIIPKSLGGSNEMDNYQIMCADCNLVKHNKESIDYRLPTYFLPA